MDNVVGFNGKPVPLANVDTAASQPIPAVVNALVTMLEQAKAGKIQAIHVVMIMSDNSLQTGYVPFVESGDALRMIGALHAGAQNMSSYALHEMGLKLQTQP